MLYSMGVDFLDSQSDEDEIKLNCPFCLERGLDREDENHKLGVNVARGIGNCFRCGWKVGEKTPNNYRVLFEALRDAFGGGSEWQPDVEGKSPVKRKRKNHTYKPASVALPTEYEPLWKDVGQDRLLLDAINYLRSRGVTYKQITKYELGYCAAGKYAGRVIFPIHYARAIVGFTGRTISKNVEPKYLNSEGEKCFYNYEMSKDACENALLVEGPMDVLSGKRALGGDCDVIGLLGSSLSDWQLMLLQRYRRLFLFMDLDQAGMKVVSTVAELYAKKMFVILPDTSADIGSLSRGEILYQMEHNMYKYSEELKIRLRYRVAFA
jgi:DNA primase